MKRRRIERDPFGLTLSAVVFCMLLLGLQGSTFAIVPALEPIQPAPTTSPTESKLQWYDARQLTIEGKGWTDTETFYHRLPAKAKGVVRDPVWNLSKSTAGLCVCFVTDATTISARWTLTSSNLAMYHMPSTGMSGLDLYARVDGTWRWVAVGKPYKQTNENVLIDGLPAEQREYLLYLPLYNGVTSLEIGLNDGAQMFKPAPRPQKPICVYGTSITQGGCAARPGMAHVAILGRRLDWPMINLGFSGNGRMEPEMASLLAELETAAYVIDCLPNMTIEMVNERAVPFVEILRMARPTTPIILVDNPPNQIGVPIAQRREALAAENRALRAAYEQLIAKGVEHLSYLSGEKLIGSDGDATVDGVHPTDVGFMRMADTFEPAIRAALGLPTEKK